MKLNLTQRTRWFWTWGLLLGVLPALASAKGPEKESKTSSQLSEWPHFRGPSQQGRAGGSLSESLRPVWRFKADGSIQSSAVIGSGRVFVGSDDNSIYALDLKSGQKLWDFTTNGAVEAPPTLLPSTLVVGSTDGTLYALDTKDGTLRWKYPTRGKILGAAVRVVLPSGKGIVAVGSYDGKLHGVDETSGLALWTLPTERITSTAAPSRGVTGWS
jgi:outer membrane protein assembly factor BamB